MYSLRIIFFLFASLGLVHSSSAQAPDWAVNASDYQYSMTVTAFLSVDGTTLSSEQDMVGAFVDGENRGSARLMYVEGADRYLAYLTVYANKVGEEVTFKIYNSATGKVVEVARTLSFGLDVQHGNVFQAFSIANPALSSEAAVTEFSFKEVYLVDKEITESKITVMVDRDRDLTNLVPEFSLSPGASLYLDRTLQVSGTQPTDFSSPRLFSVMSEDQSSLRTYEISVSRDAEGTAEFVASNAITANNDGYNDYWMVQQADRYRNHHFQIFDANGRILYESTGYNNDWNGYYKGKRLDKGKYYYRISDSNQGTIITGDILLIY